MKIKNIFKKLLLTTSLLICCSCWGGLVRKPVIKHPDSSMQFLEFRNCYFGSPQVKVAVYDGIKNKMLVKGWIDLDTLKYWTGTKHDWAKKIKKREKK